MITYYVILCPFDGTFVAAGRGARQTYNLNAAKHFTSQWSAEQWLKKFPDQEVYRIKKIQRY